MPRLFQREGKQVSKRIASIESFRVLAIFAVILWHTGFVGGLSRLAGENLAIVLTGYLVWWVGVPYFLITAGYFFRRSVLPNELSVIHLQQHVAPFAWIFTFWMCLYIVVPPNWPGEILHHGLWKTLYATALRNIQLLETENIRLILAGGYPVFHLWFLPALMFSLAALTLVAICRLQRYLIPLVVCLYILALLDEILGMQPYNLHLYVGTWSIALLFTAIGWLFAERKQPSATLAWSLIIGGYVLALMEGLVMNTVFQISLQTLKWHTFLGGIILGVGIFLLALAKPKMGQSSPFPLLAQFTMGVYVSHILVIYTLSPLSSRLQGHVPLLGAFMAIIVYAFSVLLTIILARSPMTRDLVVKSHWKRMDEEKHRV